LSTELVEFWTGSLAVAARIHHAVPMTPSIQVSHVGAVTVVTIDRPGRRNAVDPATARALLEAFSTFDTDPASSVAVLTGRGGTFCAGADLKSLVAGERFDVAEEGPGPMGPTRLALTKPVIAAIEGFAVAGGLELAIWCDLRVAADDAVFGVFCRRFGIPLIDGGTVRLPRLIGQGRALDLILSGREVRAEEAMAIGLINRRVPTGTALAAAVAWAEELAALPQTCLRNDRAAALAQWGMSVADALRVENRFGRASLDSAEAQLGTASFAAGRGRGGARLPPEAANG
jgi:enoyl-CoA hydratase